MWAWTQTEQTLNDRIGLSSVHVTTWTQTQSEQEDLKWGMKRVHPHAKCKTRGSTVGGVKWWKYSRTALPTCYRILYYYGDFPVAPSFAHKRKGIEQTEKVK